MIASNVPLGVSPEEAALVRRRIGREPSDVEWAVIAAEWSEHSSYKSSKALLRRFPTEGARVLVGPGYDAGVIDVGDGYAVTLHIESHNHPSAIDPHGGASTGIGGVLRDILSTGTRPIALIDILKFGDARSSPNSKWLFRNVVRGIADYGNCVGVPTVAGEIEFDESFERNCLVDVGCIGLGRTDSLTLGEARNPGDLIVLVGGTTGRDGVGGATFASKGLTDRSSSERSSVQVPDPFMKKLLLDSLLEAAALGLIRGMKDLGGGGLATCLSEIAAKGETGVEVELSKVPVREPDMEPTEVMTSESQERMVLILQPDRLERVAQILQKYGVPSSTIGSVVAGDRLKVTWHGMKVVDLPASLVANAPPIDWPSMAPKRPVAASPPARHPDPSLALIRLIGSPNIASKRWAYEQYDHEVGTNTVLKPGMADSALLRLPNGKMLAVKADGNSKHCGLDPRRGAAGCVAEACRNVVAVGAEPAALVDHLQFGDPSDPEVYWSLREAVEGMAEYCRGIPLPVVGGKVSLYNEDESAGRAIKPSPVAMVVGIAPRSSRPPSSSFRSGSETIIVAGETKGEMGGSEYYDTVLGYSGGVVPAADSHSDSLLYRTVTKMVRDGLVTSLHDCSRGGLGVAVAEMSLEFEVGAKVDLTQLGRGLSSPELLFSESHGRFVLTTNRKKDVLALLSSHGVASAVVGKTGGDTVEFSRRKTRVASADVRALKLAWEGCLPEMMK